MNTRPEKYVSLLSALHSLLPSGNNIYLLAIFLWRLLPLLGFKFKLGLNSGDAIRCHLPFSSSHPSSLLPQWQQINFRLERSLGMDQGGVFWQTQLLQPWVSMGGLVCGSFTSFPCGNSCLYTYVRVQTAIRCVLSYRIVPGIVIMMHKNFSFGEERVSICYSVISFHFSFSYTFSRS